MAAARQQLPTRAATPPLRGKCRYPQSHATARPIRDELAGLAANASACASFYLGTVEGMSNDRWSTEGEDHHQGLARSHRLSDGSIHFFLTHSELDTGDQGSVSWYRYDGPADGVLETAATISGLQPVTGAGGSSCGQPLPTCSRFASLA
jgi:hypothetical protein